ncbi:V-type ATP synthase subunit C [Sulfurifustis variabilis]|uniref:V-type ATP synthase subunit C n=1 Tax=Sulfurifustis variabilis TaxID=1675686 RepID=A0A1B4V5B5_9GAMM|nr:V-type ATPase subunit [Sulfurifustis variabilis]BAU48723.1 V-type ATP synthase subunit C [Sulfurifustis variabilis]
MGAVARYAYLHSRVSALSERLLSDPDVEALIAVPPGQEGEILALKGMQAMAAGGTPPSLEQRLIVVLVADFAVLARALAGRPRDFLVYWAYRFELSNLKTILRGRMTGQPTEAIRQELVEAPFARLPIDELLRTEDVAELLRRLESTPFHDIAREARRIYEERHDLFALDSAVDRRYFAGLSREARAAEGREGNALKALVGDIVDRLNLLWLLRFRFAYGLPAAETYYLLIPATYRLSARTLADLAQLGSMEEVLARLPEPLAALLAGSRDVPETTRRLERHAWAHAERVLRYSSFNLARVFAYLVLRERDLRRVRAVLKGKQLRMPPGIVRTAAALGGPG